MAEKRNRDRNLDNKNVNSGRNQDQNERRDRENNERDQRTGTQQGESSTGENTDSRRSAALEDFDE